MELLDIISYDYRIWANLVVVAMILFIVKAPDKTES